MLDVPLLIGGQSCPARDGRTFERCNPVTGEVVSRVAAATLEDADARDRVVRRGVLLRHFIALAVNFFIGEGGVFGIGIGLLSPHLTVYLLQELHLSFTAVTALAAASAVSSRLSLKRTVISSALRPDGNDSVTVFSHRGRCDGARFW